MAEKPPRKTKVIAIRVDEELHREATRRAKEYGRPLSEILRAWLRLFGMGEVRPPVESYLQQEKKRASRRKK